MPTKEKQSQQEVISYTYSWSELFLRSEEFEFGPRVTDAVKPMALTVRARRAGKERAHRPAGEQTSLLSSVDLSAFIIKMAVNSAIYIKGTSIPDKLSDLTENVVEATSLLDQHYAIRERVKVVGNLFIAAIINVCTTFIAAFLQFLIAYHNAPGIGRAERHTIEMEGRLRAQVLDDDQLVTFCVGGHTFTTQLLHILPRKQSRLGHHVLSRRNVHETVFIDRDGTHFRHIVNHLRGSDSVMHIRDMQALQDLLEECEYYQMEDMAEIVRERLTQLGK